MKFMSEEEKIQHKVHYLLTFNFQLRWYQCIYKMLVYNDSVYIKSVPYAACEVHTLLAYSTSFQKTKPVFIINSC